MDSPAMALTLILRARARQGPQFYAGPWCLMRKGQALFPGQGFEGALRSEQESCPPWRRHVTQSWALSGPLKIGDMPSALWGKDLAPLTPWTGGSSFRGEGGDFWAGVRLSPI